jgi:hypothetical protein
MAGRFTVPGHDVFSWPVTYEDFAHMWLGGMLVGFLADWRGHGWLCLWFFVMVTLFEIAMFLAGHHHVGWSWR